MRRRYERTWLGLFVVVSVGLVAGQGRDHVGLTPLTEMDGDERYQGESGGLYGDGHNEPPPALSAAATAAAAQVQPRAADGRPDPAGRIGLLAIGMSNTTQEFQAFVRLARQSAARAPAVVLVDGAQGGRDAAAWANTDEPWRTLEQRLAQAGVSAEQIQAVWLKQALAGPARLGTFPRAADALHDALAAIVARLAERFANLRLIYLSSRVYAGYATTALNPEPFAYESAFAVRRLILEQDLDPTGRPVLLWGPYLWADGVRPRADGLTWVREDFREDGTHPSDSGRRKVAEQLQRFFETDPTATPWYRRP